MIKLIIVSWVQVFITFMLAYFWAHYSKMISIMLIPLIWHNSRRMQCDSERSVFEWRRCCTQSLEQGMRRRQRGVKKGRLSLDEDYSNNYTAFLFSCLVPLTWTLSKNLPIFGVKYLWVLFLCQRRGSMKFWCGALRCMVGGGVGKLTLSLLNRLQLAKTSAPRSFSLPSFLNFCFHLSFGLFLSTESLITVFDMPLSPSLLSP